jgi:hypothetical protein
MNPKILNLILSFVIILTGCDVVMVKRLDLLKSAINLELSFQGNEKEIFISKIDEFSLKNGIKCTKTNKFIRECEKNSLSLVVFENDKFLTACLSMIGTKLESNNFLKLSSRLEEYLISAFPKESLNISSADELPECY